MMQKLDACGVGLDNIDYRLFVLRLTDVVNHAQLVLVADDQVHPLDFRDLLRAHLRIAANHRSVGLWVLANKLPDGLATLGIGQIGDRTGVDDAQIRLFPKGHDLIATLQGILAAHL